MHTAIKTEPHPGILRTRPTLQNEYGRRQTARTCGAAAGLMDPVNISRSRDMNALHKLGKPLVGPTRSALPRRR
jgi:hypothetical protein